MSLQSAPDEMIAGISCFYGNCSPMNQKTVRWQSFSRSRLTPGFSYIPHPLKKKKKRKICTMCFLLRTKKKKKKKMGTQVFSCMGYIILSCKFSSGQTISCCISGMEVNEFPQMMLAKQWSACDLISSIMM